MKHASIWEATCPENITIAMPILGIPDPFCCKINYPLFAVVSKYWLGPGSIPIYNYLWAPATRSERYKGRNNSADILNTNNLK